MGHEVRALIQITYRLCSRSACLAEYFSQIASLLAGYVQSQPSRLHWSKL